MQAAKLMNPEPMKKESTLELVVDQGIERNRKLDSHGTQYGMSNLYKLIALKKFMVGRAKEYFDIWEAGHKHEDDCGHSKILDKGEYWSKKATLESNAAADIKDDDDVDMGEESKMRRLNEDEHLSGRASYRVLVDPRSPRG